MTRSGGVPALKAVVWDVDGTMAETERDGHRVAFNQAFAATAVPWQWSEELYGQLLRITGGRERLLHDMGARACAPQRPRDRERLARLLHALKNGFYGDIVSEGRIPLRGGVVDLMQECRERGIAMAIATTTSRINVSSLLHATLGASWAQWFQAVVCGEDVQRKKPHPEVYLRVLKQLRLGAAEAVALEDSPAGATAAAAAGLAVIVTRSAYFADSPGVAAAVGPGLHEVAGWSPPVRGRRHGRIRLADLSRWHYSWSVKAG
ncbi:MAG TPA: HAD-IA family hydrolase [Steroidobacteraceae bacterium]|nr:HAD-IA family hydrolase [Steroidobacteraceae bacterium]